MLCIDGATLKEDFMVVESQGSRATLPECIELLRMMHEQVLTPLGLSLRDLDLHGMAWV